LGAGVGVGALGDAGVGAGVLGFVGVFVGVFGFVGVFTGTGTPTGVPLGAAGPFAPGPFTPFGLFGTGAVVARLTAPLDSG
jgi:hypothetical protein